MLPSEERQKGLRQDKSDDSGSEHEWNSANAVYTGGYLYKKDGNAGNSSGGNTGSTIADGIYTATSNSTVNKDGETYKATVTVTVSGGKITEITATGASSSDNKSYLNKAVKGINSSLSGTTASSNSGSQADSVSGATKSSKIIKEAIDLALSKAPTGNSESGGGSESGGNTGSTIADGIYTATSNSTVNKDGETYKATVTVTVTGGKITNITATGATTSTNRSYLGEAVKGINSSLSGTTASSTSGSQADTVSGATKSSKIVKEAIDLALSGASSGGEETETYYTVKWKSYDGNSTLATDSVKEGEKPTYSGVTPSKVSDTQYDYVFSGWSTQTYQSSGTATENLPKVSGNITYYATFRQVAKVTVQDGIYGDNSATVQNYGYTPIVMLNIKNGIIQSFNADAETNSTNQEFFGEAVEGISTQIVGNSVSATQNIDTVSGATFVSKALITEIKKAVSENPKGLYTVKWQNEDGTVLKTDSNITYGNRTADYQPNNPTKTEDSNYTYTFKGWNPTVNTFVTENVTYTAQYNAVEKETPLPTIADGIYGDNSAVLEKFAYQPIVSLTIENGIITSFNADVETNATNKGFFQIATAGIRNQIENQNVSVTENIDTVSGATFVSRALITDIQKALSESPKGTYTVKWKNDNGTVLENDIMLYGSRTAYNGGTPTKTSDSKYTYTFEQWTPTVATFVTENQIYTAQYTAEEIPQISKISGKYIDGTQYVAYGYTPVVKLTVQDNTITAVDVTTDDSGNNTYYINTGVNWLKNGLVGKTADETSVDEIDTVSGATVVKNALRQSAKKALSAENLIEWKDYDDTLLDSAYVSDGTMPFYDGDTPSRADYNFTGWTPNIHTVSGSEIYVATYEADNTTYRVIYDLDGGSGVIVDNTEYRSGDVVYVSTKIPTKKGFKFDYWTLDGKKIYDNTFTMPAKNVTVKAVWKEWYQAGIYTGDIFVENFLGNYGLHVTCEVDDYNNIVSVTAETYDDEIGLELFDFEESVTYVNENICYEDISQEMLERCYYAWNVEYGSDAPLFASDIVSGIMEALQNEPQQGYSVSIQDYTNSGATTTLYPTQYQSGVITFTVKSEKAVAVFTDNGNDTYTRLYCTLNSKEEHQFTLNVDRDVKLIIAYKGDVNLDGKVTLADAVLLNRYMAGNIDISNKQFMVADVVTEGRINLKDTVSLQRYLLGNVRYDFDMTA